MEEKIQKIIDEYKKMFDLRYGMDVTKKALMTCVNAEGKHLDFDKLLALSENKIKGVSVEFAKDIACIIFSIDWKTGTLMNGVCPKCGYA